MPLDSVPSDLLEVASHIRFPESPDQILALAESAESDLILLIDYLELSLETDHQFDSYRRTLQHLALSGHQILLITHRKELMEDADSIISVTMEEWGVSKPISMRLTERPVQ